MAKRNFKLHVIVCRAMIALLLGGGLLAVAAVAQEAKSSAEALPPVQSQPVRPRPDGRLLPPVLPSEPRPARSIPASAARPADKSMTAVYALKHANANAVLEVINAIEETIPLGPGKPATRALSAREDSILVSGPAEVHQRVKAIIQHLDALRKPDRVAQLRIYALKYAEPHEAELLLDSLLSRENEDLRVAVDERTNSVLVAAPPEQHTTAEALLKALDVPAAADHSQAAPETTLRVRVIWLADGFSSDDAPAAKNLDEVVTELTKLGLEDIRQVGQVMVHTAPNGRFQVGGCPKTDPFSADWRITGKLDQQQGTPTLEIEISANVLPVDAGLSVQLQTDISAPLGHYVVLGVTPVGEYTSAFVVQVTSGN